MAEERNFELDTITIETSKTDKKKKKDWKYKIEYSRTVGQQQKVEHMCNGDTKTRKKREMDRSNI